jgi:uncharacterized protein (TIGR03084 family)
MASDIYDDLEAEYASLDAVLRGLSTGQWTSPSAAAGWTIADVLLHLAQTEEFTTSAVSADTPPDWARFGDNVDDAMDALVKASPAPPAEILARWQAAGTASLAALRNADPDRPVRWVASSIKPRTLATTRLAEHWAHALDITGPLAIPYPDTARLRHIAWLGHTTLPYAFGLAGQPPQTVYCELTGPGGEQWRYGPPGAQSTISGSAGAFCRVGAQRLDPAESGLLTTGPQGMAALRVLRNYASI